MDGEYIAADINQDTAMVALDATQPYLDELATKYATCPDAGTKDGYKEIQTSLGLLTKCRTKVTERHKELKAPILLRTRALDGAKNHIIDSIKAIEAPMRDAKKVVDEAKAKADEEHKARLQGQMDVLRNMPVELASAGSAEIGEALEKVESFDHTNFYWFQEEAAKLKGDTRAKLGEMLSGAIMREQQAEAQRVENERLAKERAELEQKQAEQRQREEEAEAKRQQEAEARRKEQAELHQMRADKRADLYRSWVDHAKSAETPEEAESFLAELEGIQPDQTAQETFGDRAQHVIREYRECKQIIMLAIEALRPADPAPESTDLVELSEQLADNVVDIGAKPREDEEVLAESQPGNLSQGLLPIMSELAECYAKHGISQEASTEINAIVANYI
jgi:hypothetical protein